MIELLVDLLGTRLRYPPVPTALLNTLALVCFFSSLKEIKFSNYNFFQVFDTNTTFSQKHKDEPMPTNRSYKLDDEEFLEVQQTITYGWIRSFIQRVS